MSVVVDLSANFALLGKLISEIFDSNAFRPPSGIDYDSSCLSQAPTLEPQRIEYLIKKSEETFHVISERLLQPAKNTTLLIKKEIITVLIGIVRDSPTRYDGQECLENPALPKWRPKLKALAFDCLRTIFQLSPKQFIRGAQDIIAAAVRVLQSRNDRKFQELKEEYLYLSGKVYSFLSTAFGTSLIADLIPAVIVRDLADCLINDIWLPSRPGTSYEATICLALILQTRSSDLKTEVKDRIFCGLVTAVRSIIRIQQDRRLSDAELRSLQTLYETLTVFILSTAVHVGVLNVYSGVLRDGLNLGDSSISITCRMGLQVLSSILRPRVPLDVLDNTDQLTEPATGRARPLMSNGLADAKMEANSVKRDVNGIFKLTDLSLVAEADSTPLASVRSDLAVPAPVEVYLRGSGEVTATKKFAVVVEQAVQDFPEMEPTEVDEQTSRNAMEVEMSSEANDLIASFRDIVADEVEIVHS